MDQGYTTGMGDTLKQNIATLAERSHARRRQAPVGERLASAITRFSGSLTFVYVHLAVFGSWIAINLGWVPGVAPFDPTFVVLAMVASVEAIFLSTFVLIGQNRMAAEVDRRAELDLHISLLTEHELTRVAQLIDRIARRLNVAVDDGDFSEVEQDVAPAEVLDALDAVRGVDGS